MKKVALYKEIILRIFAGINGNSDPFFYGASISPRERSFWMHYFFISQPEANKSQHDKRVKYVRYICAECAKFIFMQNRLDTMDKIEKTLLQKLEIANEKHPSFTTEGYSSEADNAYMAYRMELLEFLYSLKSELPERQVDEAYDVLVTGVRFLAGDK